MRFVQPPSFGSLAREGPGDDLDGLLRSYFQAEMPEPWPTLEPPMEEALLPLAAVPRPRRWRRFRARLALAASVALLLAGACLVGGSLRGPEPTPAAPVGGRDTADVQFKQELKATPKGVEWQGHFDTSDFEP